MVDALRSKSRFVRMKAASLHSLIFILIPLGFTIFIFPYRNMRKADIQELLHEFSHKKSSSGSKKSGFSRFFRLSKKSGKSFLKWLVWGGAAALAGLGIVGVLWFYTRILPEVPRLSVDELDSLFAQTTVVTDNDGQELYKLFEQYRKNVSYEEISPHMIDAIVAVEDKSFWTNPGIDLYGIARAAYVSTRAQLFGGSVQGASTITQQSVKNLLLTNDRNITRKAKEIVLALQLDNVLEKDIAASNPSLSSDEVDRRKKQRIMELYLNYIFMGNNAYGIESASTIYFDKSASDLSIIESAILASIPKSPTRYSPYRQTTSLMGGVKISRNGTILEELPEGLTDEVNERVIQIVERTPFSRGKFVSQIQDALEFSLSYEGIPYQVDYTWGRKDHVLNRMYDEKYISQIELKDAFIQGLDMEFTRSNITDMKAPHFIFYIQEYLTTQPEFAQLGIDQESLLEGGYTIVTTLDQDIQEIAESSIRKYMPLVQQKGGSNRAMVYLDSLNGDILAYVGSADYNNESIEGENDMVSNAKRQPGSSVKPFIYANYLQNSPSTIDTPVFDIPISLGGLTPNNADGAFDGLMPIKKALGASRNIPAVKVYVAGGQEQVIKPFLQSLGMTSLLNNRSYGYSLSLGAGEVTMLELAKAYMHLSAQGRPAFINPILEIRDPQGTILYQKEPQRVEQTIITQEVAYLLWNILSDSGNMPAGWIRLFTVPGLNLAIKSGTSNKVLPNGRKVAGDGWLATYTPSKVAVFWAGNTDGSGMNSDAYGGGLNGPVMQDFYGALRDQGFLSRENMPVAPGVRRLSISEVSGRLASETTPEEYVVETLAYRAPTAVDSGMTPIEFDTMCGGVVSEYTPRDEIAQGYVITPTSIIPNTDLANVRNWRSEGNSLAGSGEVVVSTGKITYNYTHLFPQIPTEPCEERIPKIDENIVVSFNTPESNQSVSSNFSLQYAIASPHRISMVKVLVNGEVVKEIPHSQSLLSHSDTIDLSEEIRGSVTIELLVLADNGFSNSVSKVVQVTDDMTAPFLQEDQVQVQQLANGQYRVDLRFADEQSLVQNGQIRFGENTDRIHRFIGESTRVTVDTLQALGFIVYDTSGNSAAGVVPIAEYYQQNNNDTNDASADNQNSTGNQADAEREAEQLIQELFGDIELTQ